MWTHSESHPGEYLRTRFLEPLGLSASDLARGWRMPRSRVSDILVGKRAITADTAMRLAEFFRMEPNAWMDLQAAWDLDQVATDDSIVPLDPPGFLVGPLGATPIPSRRGARSPQLQIPEGRLLESTEGRRIGERQRVEHTEVRYPDGTRALVAE